MPRSRIIRSSVLRVALQEAANELNIEVAAILGGSRSQAIVAAKARICRKLRAQGFSFPEIGRSLKMHHTTVMYHAKGHSLSAYSDAPAPIPDLSGEWAI